MDSNGIPPGFGPAAANKQQACRAPEVFKLDPSWSVQAGEESQEVAIQTQREDQVLEAVYPDPSAIPESPAEPLETQLPYDDTKTLIIPHRDHPVVENVALPETEPHTTAGGASHVGQIQAFGGMIDQGLLVHLHVNPSKLQNLAEMSGTSVDHRLNKRVEQQTGLGVSGQPWTLAVSNFSGRHGEQEVSQSTPDNDPNGAQRNPDTPGVAGGLLTTTGFERPPGFGPPATVAQYLPATQPAASGSGRPFSQQDDEYSKGLIRLYGNKSEEDRVGAKEMRNSYPASALPVPAISCGRIERPERTDSGQRWSGREHMDRSGLSRRHGEAAGSVESRSGQMQGKSRQVCRYFRTRTGCTKGSYCKFLHESNDSER